LSKLSNKKAAISSSFYMWKKPLLLHEEVNITTSEIESAIRSISAKAQDGAESASMISIRASELKNKAVYSKETASRVYQTTQNKLLEAIERTNEGSRAN